MRTFAAKYLLSFASVLLVPAAAVCQNPVSYLNDVGSPAYALKMPVPNGFIDLANGNLHLEFSLASPPQRGAVTVNERLVYDSRIWMFTTAYGSGNHWWPYNIYGASNNSGGWRLIKGNETGSNLWGVVTNWTSSGCQQPYYGAPWEYDGDTWYTLTYTWTDPDGMTHPFNATEVYEDTDCWDPAPPTYNSGYATDGSGYSMNFDSYGNAYVTDRKGNQIYPWVADRYGNSLFDDSNRNLIDDTGRTPVVATTSGSTTYYDVLAPNGPISSSGGPRVRYTVTTAPVPVSTNFSSGPHEWASSSDLQPVQSIQLPDGSQYTFSYDGYGELSSMTLPTGGTVTFGYTNELDSTNTSNRWVSSYKIGTDPATTISLLTRGGAGYVQTATVDRPNGDETQVDFTISNGAWPTSTWVTNSTSALRLINSTLYTYSYPCATYPCGGTNYITHSISSTTIAGASTGVTQTTETNFVAPGVPDTIKQWDFSNTAAPSLLKETDYTYNSLGDPLTVTVKDGAGATASLTTYGYTTSASPVSPTPPNYYPSGATVPYLHTVQNWLNTDPTHSPTTTITMDATGQVTSIQDPDGHTPATITYQCGHSLPLLETNPLGQQTQYGYDCSSAAITSVQNPNDLAAPRAGTTYAYESLAGRLHSVSYPDGGSTTYSYPHPYEVDASMDASPDPTITSQVISDGFGRPYQTIQNGVTATTSYDTNGRIHCVDNPFAVGTSTSGQTCITYDVLNRPLVRTLPDGSTQQMTYDVDATNLKLVATSTDEAGSQIQSSSNALGELTKVVEVGPSGPLTTNYTYNTLGNLTSINQQGLGTPTDSPRNRSFDYDSLSRLLCASNPENSSAACPGGVGTSYGYTAGTVGYGYDPNGNVTSMEDARGITVTSTYDALNRLITKTHSPDINYAYTYDSRSGLPNANSIGRMVYATNNVNAAEAFSYDAMGRINWQTDWTPFNYGSSGWQMTATYDHAGNMRDFTYPNTNHIQQSFDASGRLTGVNYVDSGGISVNYPYVSGITYSPLGGMSSMTLGNTVVQSASYNNRSQPCEIKATYPALPGGSTPATIYDKQYYFVPTGGSVCGTAPSNNGNVWRINDALSSSYNATFTFDSLNRLTTGVRGDNKYNYTYNLDSFGNMTQQNNLITNPPISFPDATNQLHLGGVYTYDAAGNLTDTGSSSGGHSFTYDAIGQQTLVDGGTTKYYTYDALGHRVEKYGASSCYNDYAYFGSTSMAEWSCDWTMIDNIYANGQLVARDHSMDTYIHFTGNNSTGGNSWAYPIPIPSGITIQSGAKLVWRQYQTGAAAPQGGIGLVTTSSTWSNWWMHDTDGEVINSDTTQNMWHNRMVDLTPLAGQTLSWAFLTADTNTGAGHWDEKFADIAIVEPDGTVYSIYNQQTAMSLGGGWGTSGVSGQTVAVNVEYNHLIPTQTTHYFTKDHLGTSKVEFAGGGWPVWGDDYAPYGQEVSPTGSPQFSISNYKFTSYERDPETGNDYAQARYYSSQYAGRFVSPDPYLGSMNLGNPQSLNRYTYAMNNPLKFSDPTGLYACAYPTGQVDAEGNLQFYIYYDEQGGCGGDGYYLDNGGADDHFDYLIVDSSGDVTGDILHGVAFNADGNRSQIFQSVSVDSNNELTTYTTWSNNSGLISTYTPTVDLASDPSYQLAAGVAARTKDATQLLNCTVIATSSLIPGLSKAAGMPSYKGLPTGLLTGYLLKGLEKYPSFSSLYAAIEDWLWVPGVINAGAIGEQCLAGPPPSP